MSKIYTKTGDDGETWLYGGVRVKKNSKVIRVLGEIDELNSFVGFAWNACEDEWVRDVLKNAQIKLYEIGAQLAGSDKFEITPADIEYLEKSIDFISTDHEFSAFTRPGERGEFSARVHLCRSICRKAERSMVKLTEDVADDGTGNGARKHKYIVQYLNRLSDLLFAIAELK